MTRWGRLAAFTGLLAIGAYLFWISAPFALFGTDGYAYWSAWSHGGLYQGSALYTPTYVYPPPFAQALYPLTLLPWEAFRFVAMATATLAFAWLLAPLPRAFRIASMLALTTAILVGNVEWLIAVVVVLGFDAPTLWAIPAIIKVTPGVAALWFVVRREWRALGLVVATGALVALISFVLDPTSWMRWLEFARRATLSPEQEWWVNRVLPLWPRLAAAIALVIYAARTDRRWLMPIVVVLAQPDLNPPTFALLAAVPRLTRRHPAGRAEADAIGARRAEAPQAIGAPR